jgi:two-component system response regulator HydG
LLPGEFISERELPLSITEPYSGEYHRQISVPLPSSFPLPLEEIEKEAILSALEAAEGNKSEAARKLGINRKTLHKKLKIYGVN